MEDDLSIEKLKSRIKGLESERIKKIIKFKNE